MRKSSPIGKQGELGAKLRAQRSTSADPASRNPPHLIIEAMAGTGKTTTLIEGLKRVKGIKSNLTPSPQQAAVWDSMLLSKGARTVCFVAFNKSIATELQRRVPEGCDAMTMHSMGFKAVTKALGRQKPDTRVVQDIISELLDRDIHWLRANKPVVLKATEELVSLCKMNLVGFSRNGHSINDLEAELDRLAAYYEVDTNGFRREVYDLVPYVLDLCKAPRGRISFDDMIWLPVVLNLPVFQYDLLLVDEAQDLNRCQQALARRAGRRLILCGDPRQAIYGFAGADTESMPRMASELGKTEQGCITLPLTVTRRCGRLIVEEARKIVSAFEAHESNPEGKISYAALEGPKEESPSVKQGYRYLVKDGDMVLCRVNAPLVSQCFRFLRDGRKANIQGRDIGAGLIGTVKKLSKENDSTPVTEFLKALDDWLYSETAKENAKRHPSEAKIIAIQDRRDCLACFAEDCLTVGQIINRIETVFTDNREIVGILLSSIHKAKGLEAKRVFLLEPSGATVPHPMAKSSWQVDQEWNLRYVAITRAIEELVYVS